MLLSPLIGQGGTDLLIWILPIAVILFIMNQGKGNRDKGDTVIESWYTTLGVEDAYSAVVEEADKWREEDKRNAERISSSLTYRALTLFSGRRAGDRFEVVEDIPPQTLQDAGPDRPYLL